MPTSAHGCCSPAQALRPPRTGRGFTLIEVLVVCAIMATALAFAALKLDVTDGARLKAAAEDLAGRLENARDEAVIRGQAIAFSSDGQGYQFWLADRNRNAWVVLADSAHLVSGRFAGGAQLQSVVINGSPRPVGERITFSPVGLSDAFSLSLSIGPARLEILADALGRIEIRHAL
ncbi:GspH/FimT family pseudopilin [Propionivibrio dicarboxylicus]|uniref:Type II secretion system protein H n=1 Tax=Propionivibrio dicarboxylicus TaxID=83767 RepID=A0A1G8ALG0_9RHOO|nr:GspH/FimT family pseudopilin [Propionivibrio dicarboxylicus]SDH21774.1 N-terminal methylation site-containing protein [Propionivibrio dicarboxylicus]